MSQPRFRVQTRYVLLTYAQCGDLDEWRVHDVITSFPAECLIARETHADGGIHLHAFVDFGRRVDIRDPRLLSINTPRPFDLALQEFRNSMNGYVTICLELRDVLEA